MKCSDFENFCLIFDIQILYLTQQEAFVSVLGTETAVGGSESSFVIQEKREYRTPNKES